ncbi:ComEC/Rec2 family competence protein [Chryseobacterium sp. c4a]|uniref:ComEC/Rec2 family competence protein n=1 Tax=Chryseobacterium sp. c4a TaxID=1573582 RepID=UPI001357EF46|nr:MBL fold metallo-hydrolase [Chryseobacterium sp. c4a]
MKREKTEFKILEAYHGDSILIKTYDKDFNEFIILIDGGTATTFRYSLKKELNNISKIDLLILTHIDSDHIGGLIHLFTSKLIEKIEIGEIWFNHPEILRRGKGSNISVGQSESFLDLIKRVKPYTEILSIDKSMKKIDKNGIVFTILSPTNEILSHFENVYEDELKKAKKKVKKRKISIKKNDYGESLISLSENNYTPLKSIKDDIFNSTSIAFILQTLDLKFLLLADARPEVIEECLGELGYTINNKLDVDYVKISHHGSKNNTSQSLLSLINCSEYIISTNGGTADHHLPDRETIARIVHNKSRNKEKKLYLYFNYPVEVIARKIGNFISEEDLNNGNWIFQNKNEF